MKKISFSKLSTYFLAIVLISTLFSCGSVKNVKYLGDIPDSAKMVERVTAQYVEPVISADDILSITIQTIDPTNTSTANQGEAMPVVGSGSQGGTALITGYLVDKNGEVSFPLIGKVKLSGYTTFQARDVVQKRASVFYKDPSVQVRFANFKVTVLGEVNKPNTYTLPNERVSIFDVLGLAGDLTIYGKRDNIMLIRQVDGNKNIARLNLTSSNIFKSDYYYLKQNDVIYVEPDKSKSAALNAPTRTYIALILTAISSLAVALSRL
ncbi:polysaccharide biosynthesis/export family protein [Mucilaginibacter lappiensis]|jgi:polysaccharide export outer membrane protein|uniref:polysaccharide biosynthesis/export family protein n=1 Tax=Mucilaginibacter lappiensis TaxID=354630 RepID=UPI003D236A75